MTINAAIPQEGTGTSPASATDGARPIIDYMIASIQRTGSSLFCQLLRQSGPVGRVGEYLTAKKVGDMTASCGGERRQAILRLIEESRGNTGICGVKIHFHDWKNLLKDFGLEEILPRKIIMITRQDRVAQAVSLVKARQTQAWSSDRAAIREAVYDYDQILEAMRFIGNEEADWNELFQSTGRQPMRIRYEDLVADPVGKTRAAMEYLGIPPKRDPEMDKVKYKIQRDAQSDEWIAAFRAEYLDRLRAA